MDLAVARLTIFNARRGGEPAKLELSEWMDADNGVWTKHAQHCEDLELDERLKSTKIAYQSGKGMKLVSLMIPEDTVSALRILANKEIREKSTIHNNNKYVFPSAKLSLDNANGWHSLRNVVKEVEVKHPERLTATKIRHRTSRTKIRTSAARSMHSKLSVFHCDCYMQNLIKGPRL